MRDLNLRASVLRYGIETCHIHVDWWRAECCAGLFNLSGRGPEPRHIELLHRRPDVEFTAVEDFLRAKFRSRRLTVGSQHAHRVCQTPLCPPVQRPVPAALTNPGPAHARTPPTTFECI